MTKITTLIKKLSWDEKVDLINWLHKELQSKPHKLGYALCFGGILNAYREGDLDFDSAEKALIKWIHMYLDNMKSDIEHYVERGGFLQEPGAN